MLSKKTSWPLQQRRNKQRAALSGREDSGIFHPAGEETTTGSVKSDACRQAKSAAISADYLPCVCVGGGGVHQLIIQLNWSGFIVGGEWTKAEQGSDFGLLGQENTGR